MTGISPRSHAFPEGDKPSDYQSASDVDAPAYGMVVVVASRQLLAAVEPAVRSATALISQSPSSEEVLRLVGPLPVGGLFPKRSSARRIIGAIRRSLVELPIPTVSRAFLSVLVVDTTTEQLEKTVAMLTRQTEFLSLPWSFRGLSLEHVREGYQGAPGVPESSVAMPRLDTAIRRVSTQVLTEAALDPDACISTMALHAALGIGQPEAEPMREADEAVLPSEDSLLSPAKTTPGDSSQDARVGGESEAYAVPEELPLRLTFLVAALTLESRTRGVRQRVTDLVLSLDRALVPVPDTVASRTWLISASGVSEHDPLMKITGTLLADDIWKPSFEYVDLGAALLQTRRMIEELSASYSRRSHLLVEPLVILVVPSARLSGERALSSYRKLIEVACVRWLLTDSATPSVHAEIDPGSVVVDKDDVINELLSTLPPFETH